MKKDLIITFILSAALLITQFVLAQENLAQKLSGRILLQVQSSGKAWYINPADQKKYYLGRPNDAFDLMRNLSIGITNENLSKIPIGIIKGTKSPIGDLVPYAPDDDDNDGLTNSLENAIGTNPQNSDSDNDGYDDKTEIANNYNPLGAGKLNIDENFIRANLGKIFLQTEQNGQAWYINPTNKKRYYLGKPVDAFAIMKNLSLGITNENLNKITTGYYSAPTPPAPTTCTSCQSKNPDQIFAAAAGAIRSGNKTTALSYFTPEMQKAVEYTMDFLDAEGKLILGNIMSGAKLSSSTNDEKTYFTEVYFSLGGYKVPIHFYVKKQGDGSWKLTNL
ncbi:hypothetical protein KAU19_06670 [Candidatus Parcubacteria bacterium]|nr:hypothetical protein [Candidatus Parcubacteria bacterium]